MWAPLVFRLDDYLYDKFEAPLLAKSGPVSLQQLGVDKSELLEVLEVLRAIFPYIISRGTLITLGVRHLRSFFYLSLTALRSLSTFY